jgi:NAD(P)-dependent dehydrogenase (short-subunit alcohol dehydrogenase family)
MNNVDVKIVLITGANRGIGRETARQLAGRGFRVIIVARRESSSRDLVQEIGDAGGAAAFLSLDVSDSQSVTRAGQELVSLVDRVDVLINNAGIYPDEGVSLLTVPRETMVHTFHTNTFGPLQVTQAMLPYLQRGQNPRIINVSSGYGQLDGMSPDVPSYCLSKFALNGLTIMLADALGSEGIAVNAMCPGWVRTDMGGANATRSVEEGADTAVWLAAEAPQELTGKFFRDRKEIAW